jgi:hypothetical protein
MEEPEHDKHSCSRRAPGRWLAHLAARILPNGRVVVAGSVLMSAGIERLGSTSTTLAAAPSLMRSAFARHVGDMFRIQVGSSGPAALQLFKARDLRSMQALLAQGRAVDPEHTFSLLFCGPVDRPLDQKTYRFEHDQIGGFELFIVPMRAEHDGRYYEAIFN